MAASVLHLEYVGRKGSLFRLALVSSVLTVLTLGIYRFWMKTRLRRYYWSAIRPGGLPLEYVGEPIEKLLGFLIAVVILAFYIGVVNLILMFLSFSLLQGNFAAYALSLVGVIPVGFYARYRARRYILARSRWRGLRFGLAPGAWGYAGRALLHWSITILSLGLLWPRMTFKLEKYRTDRTFFGTEQFNQGGRWQMLYPVFVPFVAGLVVLGLALGLWAGGFLVPAVLAGLAGVIATLLGLLHYKVQSFRLLSNAKTLGNIGFSSNPRTWRVMGIYIFGYLVVGICMVGLAFALFAVLGSIAGSAVGGLGELDLEEMATGIPVWIGTALALISYFVFFVSWGVLQQVFITLPLARHYVETLKITGAEGLSSVRQRERDEFTEAEGFAEALDLGAAI